MGADAFVDGNDERVQLGRFNRGDNEHDRGCQRNSLTKNMEIEFQLHKRKLLKCPFVICKRKLFKFIKSLSTVEYLVQSSGLYRYR